MKKTLKSVMTILLLAAVIGVPWYIIRQSEFVTCSPKPDIPDHIYGEEEKVLDAICLSYFVYGCENQEEVATIAQLIEEKPMGILIENVGLKRVDQDDPTTTPFDTATLISKQVGHFRLFAYTQDEESSFYGAAFADDEKRCVWISYAGSVSAMDALYSAGLVIAPHMTRQENCAFELYEAVCQSDEIQNQQYSLILTGHSLGGALATMVSAMTGIDAITINGADGVAIDKIRDIADSVDLSHIENYMTDPTQSDFSVLKEVQRLMYLGSWQDVKYHVYHANSYTTEPHGAFSFIEFTDDTCSQPVIPSAMREN